MPMTTGIRTAAVPVLETADNEHGDEQDDVAVDEARKSGLDIQHAGNDQTDTDDHGCYAERNLLPDKHHDGKQQK